VASLADQLPSGYKNDAQAAAQAYRKLNPNENWASDISSTAINRQVPVDFKTEDELKARLNRAPSELAPGGFYESGKDRFSMNRALSPAEQSVILRHELVHASQYLDKKRPVQTNPALQAPLKNLLPAAGFKPEAVETESKYLTDPVEQEAYLSTIKQDHFARTGKHIRTPEEARALLESFQGTTSPTEFDPSLSGVLRTKFPAKSQADRAKWLEGLSKTMPGLVQGNSLDLSKTAMDENTRNALIGAGLGGTVFGLSDWLSQDENSPDSAWDGALYGAGLGGLVGYNWPGASNSRPPEYKPPKPRSGSAENRNRSSAKPAKNESTDTLAAHLPPGYRNEAQAAAEAYRKATGIPFKEDISDAAIDRPVRVSRAKTNHSFGGMAAAATYEPGKDLITVPPGQEDTMGHELTHAAQPYRKNRLGFLIDDAKETPTPDHKYDVSDIARARGLSGDMGDYLTNPREEEAYLADIKRHYFQATGKHIRTPEEARKALEWRVQNMGSSKPLGQSPDGTFPLLDALLQTSKNKPKLGPARETWIEALIQKLPGLVQGNPLDLSKTANFPGANAMTPTPNMGGFMGGMPNGNNFSHTFQPGMPPLPQKPNQLASAPPVQSMKADTNGIQTAMAKRGSQDNSAKRISATGESKGVGYKLDDDGHTTGGSAFGTLDKYMKKAGLNSFQAQFFGRLIQSGMDEARLRQAVKVAHDQFGPAVSIELNDGLEKLSAGLGSGLWAAAKGVGQNVLPYAKSVAKNVGQKAKGLMGGGADDVLKPTVTNAAKAAPALPNPVKALPSAAPKTVPAVARPTVNVGGGASPGGVVAQQGRSLAGDTLTGAATGAFNPYTGLTSDNAYNEDGSMNWKGLATSTLGGAAGGRALGRAGFGNAAQATQRRMMGGAGAGGLAAEGAQALGYDVDPTKAMQVGGLAGMIPSRASRLAEKIPTDPLDAVGSLYKNRQAIGSAAGQAGNWARNNPMKALNIGGLAAGAAGATQVPGMIDRSIQRAGENAMNDPRINELLTNMPKTVQDGIQTASQSMMDHPEVQKRMAALDNLINSGQQTMSNVNSAVSPFVGADGKANPLGGVMSYLGLGGQGGQGGGIGSQISSFVQNNPEMLTRGLLGALGVGGGYMLGGRGGAAMGGIGLPMMHYLAQQYGGLPATTQPPTTNPAERQAIQEKERENTLVDKQTFNPVVEENPAATWENEIARQQQQQQYAPIGTTGRAQPQTLPGVSYQTGGIRA
jgi:hypothetical protein